MSGWRRLEADDAPAVERAFEDPDLRAWGELPADTFALVEGELLSLVAVIPEPDPESFELACWTAPPARGRGLAAEGLRYAADYALRELDAERVWVEIDPANAASHRVAEKAGFTREGVLRSHCRDRRTGLRHDCVIYSLLPGDR